MSPKQTNIAEPDTHWDIDDTQYVDHQTLVTTGLKLTLICKPEWNLSGDPRGTIGLRCNQENEPELLTRDEVEKYLGRTKEQLESIANELFNNDDNNAAIAEPALWALCVSKAGQQLSESHTKSHEGTLRYKLDVMDVTSPATKEFGLLTAVGSRSKPAIYLKENLLGKSMQNTAGEQVTADSVLVSVKKCGDVLRTDKLWRDHFASANTDTRQTLFINHVLGELTTTLQDKHLSEYKPVVDLHCRWEPPGILADWPEDTTDFTDYGIERFKT